MGLFLDSDSTPSLPEVPRPKGTASQPGVWEEGAVSWAAAEQGLSPCPFPVLLPLGGRVQRGSSLPKVTQSAWFGTGRGSLSLSLSSRRK